MGLHPRGPLEQIHSATDISPRAGAGRASDLALHGAVSDGDLLLNDQPPVGPGERFGEQAVLDARYGAFDFG
jgi:hypothetical protein